MVYYYSITEKNENENWKILKMLKKKTMALAEYEKRNGQKVVSWGQIIYFWVLWTFYLVTS